MKKKIIPAAVAVGLIVIVAVIGILLKLLDKYSYSHEKADSYAYFGVTGEEETAIVLNDEIVETKAVFKDGQCYLPIDFVNEQMNNHFYYDSVEGLVIFTTDYDKAVTQVGSTDYTMADTFTSENYVLTTLSGDTVYLSLDYLKKFCNFSSVYFAEPNRIVLSTVWETEKHAQIQKDTQVRVLGGIKSEILTEVAAGTDEKLWDTMENWSKVKTADGYIGYVENKRLENEGEMTPAAVTDVPVPEYASIKRDGKICLAWNLITTMTANGQTGELLANTQGVNVISPTWFMLSDVEGNFVSLADAAYVQEMHGRGIEVWAMISDFSHINYEDNLSKEEIKEVLSITSRRNNLITQLIDTVRSYEIDGINVDFEYISQEASAAYIQFLRELSIECRKNGIVLSVDNGFSVNYDRAKQAEVVDYVIIMGYDEFVSAEDGGPGPCASIDFVKRGIEKTLAVVPKEKIINAIPFYTRLWTVTGDIGNRAYGMQEIENILVENNVQTEWDEETCQYIADYTVDGVGYSVWVEDKDSITVKLNVMAGYQLAGVACWRLGQEKADVWEPIALYLQQ